MVCWLHNCWEEIHASFFKISLQVKVFVVYVRNIKKNFGSQSHKQGKIYFYVITISNDGMPLGLCNHYLGRLL